MAKLPGEGSPADFEKLVQAAYAQIINPSQEQAGVPLVDRLREAVGQLPGAEEPIKSGSSDLRLTHPLEQKFTQFGRVLLATSPDVDEFARRTGLLFHPELRSHYATAAQNAVGPPKRLSHGMSAALDIGIEGLTAFVDQQQELREEAIRAFAETFKDPDTNYRYLRGVPRLLAAKIHTTASEFRAQYAGKVFHGRTVSARIQLIADTLRTMDFGEEVSTAVGTLALESALLGPLGRESFRNLKAENIRLANQVMLIEDHLLPEGETEIHLRDRTETFRNAHHMLRRLATYVGGLGSSTAESIARSLPETTAGVTEDRYDLVDLANGLTDRITHLLVTPGLRARRLDVANFSAYIPQAFDRLLWLLRIESKGRSPARTREAEVITKAAIDHVYFLLDIPFSMIRPDISVNTADVLVLFPDMPAQKRASFRVAVQGMISDSDKAGRPSSAVYNYFKQRLNHRRVQYWKFASRRVSDP